MQRDLRELGPTTVLAPPRIWENMLTSVQVRAADATPLKRVVFARFRRVAEEAEILRSDGKPVPLWLRLQLAMGEFLVYGPIRDQLGLRRARWAYTGGCAARSGHLPLLPVHRGEPQAGLRLHRIERAHLDPARRRGQPHLGGPAVPRHRGQDRRPGRGADPQPGHLQGLLQGRGGHPGGRGRRGLVPYRRRGLPGPARAPGHHRPRQGRGGAWWTAPPSRPSSSRTSSSSAPTSGRRWPSATRSRSWPR